MNCRRAQSEIALWVGNDLDEAAERQLQRHLAACPTCREYSRQMRASMRMLQHRDDDPAPSPHDSLWPGLSVRLPSEDRAARANRFNGWVPGVAIVAACVTIVVTVINRPVPEPHLDSTLIRPMPVGTYRSAPDPAWGTSHSLPDKEIEQQYLRLLHELNRLRDENRHFPPPETVPRLRLPRLDKIPIDDNRN